MKLHLLVKVIAHAIDLLCQQNTCKSEKRFSFVLVAHFCVFCFDSVNVDTVVAKDFNIFNNFSFKAVWKALLYTTTI